MLGKDAVTSARRPLRARQHLALALLVSAAMSCPVRVQGYPLFAPPSRSFETRGRVVDIAVGDFNRDGKPDLVVANDTARVVSVLLGSGDGRFEVLITLPTSAAPATLAVGDLDSDGSMDIVVGMPTSIGVLMGHGDGTFDPLAVRAIQGGATQVLACELNGDGHPDLVYLNSNGQAVQSMLGNGNGAFGVALVRQGLLYPNGCALGDLNADGKLDLVVGTGDCSGEMSRALGNGDGTFGPVLQFDPLVCNPYSPAIGDATGDGKADAIVSLLSRAEVAVYPGNGDGTFGTRSTFALGGACFTLALRDFNADGRLDIASTSVSPAAVSTLLATSSGFLAKQDCAVGGTSHATTSGDFNLDGLPDLAVGGYSSKSVTILLNSGGALPLAVPQGARGGARLGLRVAPNPLRGSSRATFSLTARAKVRLRVFDLAGRLVADRDLGALDQGAHDALLGLDTASTRAGFYLVQLRANGAMEMIGAPFVK